MNNIKNIIFVYNIIQQNFLKQLIVYYNQIIKIKGNKKIIFNIISNKNDLIHQQKILKVEGHKFRFSINMVKEEQI